MDALPCVRVLLVRLLREVQPQAKRFELVHAPPDHYTLRIRLPGDVTKDIILAHQLVERSPRISAAWRSLRQNLESELVQQRTSRAADRSRATRFRGTRLRSCSVCDGPITGGDSVIVRRARILHRGCDPLNRPAAAAANGSSPR